MGVGIDEMGDRGLPLAGLLDRQCGDALRRINHHGLPAAPVRDQITIGRSRPRFKSLNNHSVSPPGMRARTERVSLFLLIVFLILLVFILVEFVFLVLVGVY